MKNIIYTLFISLVLFSCATHKRVAEGEAVEMKTQKLIDKTKATASKFKFLSIQGKINVIGLGENLNANINIENKKKIWINVSKFGITGARALISPKGFQAYEKLGKTYYDDDFSFLNEFLSVDFINYEKLQNLILGRVFVDLDASKYKSKIVDGKYELSYTLNDQIKSDPKEGEYIQVYTLDTNFNLISANLIDPKRNKEIDITYSDWIYVDNESYPKNVKIIIKDKKIREIELEYNIFTHKEVETPFKIPSGYKKKEIR